MDLLITLEANASIPLHRQLYEEVRRMILSGRLAAGEKVPSTRALAKSLGISRATATMSYEFLLSEGYLEATTGAGTFVCRTLPEDMLRPPALPAEVGDGTQELSDDSAHEAEVVRGLEQSKKRRARLSWYGESLQNREWLGFSGEEPEIQFTFGRPDLAQFPMRQWMQLQSQHARKRALSLLDTPSRAQGYLPLCEALTGYLSRSRAVSCEPEQIIIVNGSQQGIDLVTRVLIDRGDFAGIEEPGYLGAQKSLQTQGAEVIPLPVDASGLKTDVLRRRFDVHTAERLKMLYLTPSHQFPTGVVLSLPRRLEILSWAERTGTYIVEDDYDSEYRYKGRPVPALAGLDHGGSVIYIGTFSKVLLPALRLGYLVVPRNLISVFSRAKWLADRHSPLLEQQVLADFIRLGHLERHIRRMRALYEHKRKLVIETIARFFGGRATIFGDNAGINMLVRFDTDLWDTEIMAQARAAGVGISSANQYYQNEAPYGEFLLNYGGLSEEEIVEGLLRLSRIIMPSAFRREPHSSA